MSHSTGLLFQAVKSCGISWEEALALGCAKAFYLCPQCCFQAVKGTPHMFTNHVADENFWKVLEQLNKLSKPSPASQYKGQVLGLFEVSSPTSGTQPLCLPKATCWKNWNFWVFFFPWRLAVGLCCQMPQWARGWLPGLNSVKCKKCKKWQLCNLFNLLRLFRSNLQARHSPFHVLPSLWNSESQKSAQFFWNAPFESGRTEILLSPFMFMFSESSK